MNSTGSERVGPMLNPPHLGELIRESMDEVGKAGVSANMALALETLGWGTARDSAIARGRR